MAADATDQAFEVLRAGERISVVAKLREGMGVGRNGGGRGLGMLL